MTITVRLLSYYDGNSFNTIVRLPDALAATFIAQGNATLDLTGGINRPPSLPTRANRGPAQLIYSSTGQFLGLGDTQNNLLLSASGATLPGGLTAPGAPTGLTLTALAGAVSAAFTPPTNNGGDPDVRYELVLSNGIRVTGGSSPIAAASPAGLAVTGVLYAVTAVGTSPASNTSNSVTPTGVAPPAVATAINLIGPNSAAVGSAATYTVSLLPVGGTVASPVTVTPTPVTGVTFAPASVQLSTASPSATFTATASTAGTKAIAVTSTGGLSAPAAINLVVSAAGVAPTVATQPAITGTPQQGVPLSITSATFNGTPTPTVTRTIKVAGVTVATGPQASTNYTPSAGDVGKIPTVEATATNSEGSVTTNVVSGPAIIAAAAGNAKRARGATGPSGSIGTVAAVTANNSFKVVQTVPAAYTRVRAILLNNSTSAAATNSKAAFSPSESLANNSTPTIAGVASHASTLPFLFGGSASVTLPVAPSTNNPSRTYSDWMDVASLARTDEVGSMPLAYATRFLGDTTGIGYNSIGATFGPAIESISGSKHRVRNYNQGSGGSDTVANPALFATTAAQSGIFVPIELEFDYAIPVRSVLQAGDSTKAGQGNTAKVGPIWYAAAQLASEGTFIGAQSIAQEGLSAVITNQRVQAIMASTTLDTLYFQPYSVNDGFNYATSATAAKARADAMITACAASGTNLIIETPLPIVAAGGTAVTGAELTALNDMTAYFLSKVSAVVKCLNMSGLQDPAKPGVWDAAYGFDNYHPNPAGHQYQGTQLANAIRSLT